MKKIIIFGFVLITIFLIYLVNMDKKVYYLTLGDFNRKYDYSFHIKDYLKENDILERYVYNFSSDKKRITDIINDIEKNIKFKGITLKNALVKADLVTINIDNSDVIEKLSVESPIYDQIYNYVDDLCVDLEKLFKVLREYCKEDIIFLGYCNSFFDNADSSDVIDYINKRYKELCNVYNISFVDLSDLKKYDSKIVFKRVKTIINKKILEG